MKHTLLPVENKNLFYCSKTSFYDIKVLTECNRCLIDRQVCDIKRQTIDKSKLAMKPSPTIVQSLLDRLWGARLELSISRQFSRVNLNNCQNLRQFHMYNVFKLA